MSDGDEILFRDESEEAAREEGLLSSGQGEPWKVLIVDDEEDVHNVTAYMIRDLEYLGRGLRFFHAYSGAEAREIMRCHPDMALVLLDVVMETDDSGLRLVRFIREELENRAARIILRTGQPGKAPAARVIIEYDINDYKEKTELSLEKMVIAVISALRNYDFIAAIEHNRRGLKMIIDASAAIFERQSLQKLGSGVLSWLGSVLQMEDGFLRGSLLAGQEQGRRGEVPVVLAASD